MRKPKSQSVRPAPIIRPVHRYAGWVECMIHLRVELARNGMEVEDLKPYQSTVFHELAGGLSETAISDMLSWWLYDQDALQARSRHDRMAKPRIEISMHFNQSGNFTLLWQPTGAVNGRPGRDCDWKHWYEMGAYAGSRPTNELIWIRDLRDVWGIFCAYARPPRAEDALRLPESLRSEDYLERAQERYSEYIRADQIIDSILLQGTAALVDLLKQRLSRHFEVTWDTNIYLEFDEVTDKAAPFGTNYRLISWNIDSVGKRTKDAETAELASLEERIGCSRDEVLEAYHEVHKHGEAYSEPDRLSKLLKKRGYSAATPAPIRRLLELLQKHEPSRFPPSKAMVDGNVVPFKQS